jgi:hypothetical protein
MHKIYASIDAYGESFSPKAVVGISFNFKSKNEVGEMGKYANQKGKPLNCGHASIEIPLKAGESCFFSPMSESIFPEIQNVLKKCRDAGADHLIIHIDIDYNKECHVEIDPKWLRLFGSLGIPLAITFYDI